MKFGLILATDLSNPTINNLAPIGLGCLAASIKKYLPKVEVVLTESPDELIAECPDIIGISSSTEYYDTAIKWANKFKQSLNIPIVIGGIHISLVPESITYDFDVAVIGEGDITIVELLESFLQNNGINKEELKSVPGLYFRLNNVPVTTPPRPIIKDLNTLPRIDWQIIPFYKDNQSHIVSARGCPYKCSFCASQKFANQFRFYSAENIMKEIEYYIIDKGCGGITFYDDLFIANKERLQELISLMKKRNLLGKCRFHGQVRANLITEETCKLLKELNFITVGIGLESFSDKILKYYNKTGITSQTNYNAINLLSKYDIHVNPSMIFGAPVETKEDMLTTLRAIYQNFETGVISSLAWGVLRPYPGTAVWDHAEKQGIVSNNMDWRKFTEWGTYALYMCEHVSPDDFDELINEWITKYSLLNFDRLNKVQGNVTYHNRQLLFDQTVKYQKIISARLAEGVPNELGDDILNNIEITKDRTQILLSGWERKESDGTRWISKTATGMFKSGDKGIVSFTLYIPPKIFNTIYEEELTVQFYNENILISSQQITAENYKNGAFLMTFKVPSNAVILLKIKVNKQFTPKQVDSQSPDDRRLSLIISNINFS